MKNLRANSFFIGLAITLLAAWLFPAPGAEGGFLQPSFTTRFGIMVIFFNLGLMLPSEQLRDDLREWRLHVFIQSCTYLLIPLIVLAGDCFWRPFVHPDLRLGFFYLAALPTTISTAVVFTMNARGNLIAAVFNTSISNLLAVIILPTWSVWILAVTTDLQIPLLPLFVKIALLLLAPLVVGQLVRPWLRSAVARWKPWLARINTWIIFFLVYAAFCDSVLSGVWQQMGWPSVAITIGIVVMLLGTSSLIVWTLSGRFGFKPASRRAAFFCGSQKSLATGVAMAPAIFGTTLAPQAMSLILLPILCFHPLQLLLGGYLAARWQSFEHEG